MPRGKSDNRQSKSENWKRSYKTMNWRNMHVSMLFDLCTCRLLMTVGVGHRIALLHTAASYGEPSNPMVVERAARPDSSSQAVATDTHRLNQTCATLFESPAPVDGSKVTVPEETPARTMTKLSRVREEGSSQNALDEEEREKEGETIDYQRGESIETIAGDVIILDDDVTGNNHPAPAPAHSSSKSAIVQTKENVSAISDDLQSNLPPGPVHIVYSHARVYSSDVHPFEDENEQSLKKSHTRPLSLRDAGTSKVKWRELSSSNLASSSTSSNLSETKALSPERVAGSPDGGGGRDSNGTSASSSPEQSSPSLLGASNSPWKLQQSNSSSSSRQLQEHTASSISTPVNMTHSLFAKTPIASRVVTTTPISMLKSAIPPSDSQFSLDVSQTAPLSPELCPLTTPTQKTHPPPPPRETIPASSAILKPPSKDTPTISSVNCSVVPITPGVPSVNKILKGRRRWMKIHDQSPDSEKTAVVASHDERTSAVRETVSVGGKRSQEQVNFEDEDILPRSKVHRLASMNDTAASHTVDDDHTRLEYEHIMDSSEEEFEGEGDNSPMSPVLVSTTPAPATATVTASRSSNGNTSVIASQSQGTTANNQSYRSTPRKSE